MVKNLMDFNQDCCLTFMAYVQKKLNQLTIFKKSSINIGYKTVGKHYKAGEHFFRIFAKLTHEHGMENDKKSINSYKS